jgi:phosphatidylglycerol---prolipoprotein diacylglyceryl transferase
LADIMAPMMMIGLCLGRLGCLLNGCCYGGLCAHGITFPANSPPYVQQRSLGLLHGFGLDDRHADAVATARSVTPDSPAQVAGLAAGDIVRSINGLPHRPFARRASIWKRPRRS